MKSQWTVSEMPPQTGRRVLITGGNSGIGFEAALQLGRAGAEIVLPARTLDKSNAAIERIQAVVPGSKLRPGTLDLADLDSVRAFAARFVEQYPGPSIDLLINNAGVMALPTREVTKDGLERQIATNFFGPFALTGLLLASVKPQPGSRVVTVASGVANRASIDFDNLQSERVYKPMTQAYAQSKLADLLFALELQRRLTAIGSPVLSIAAHPGYAVTNLQGDHLGFGLKVMIGIMKPLLSQDAAHGALPTLFAAVSPAATPGGYYGPDGFQELKGLPTAAAIPKAARDEAVARRLWDEAERLTGVKFPVA